MKIVAEIGLAHEGSLGNALAYIDACAKAGVDAVKFQCHYGDPVDKFRPGTFFPQDTTRQDYWNRTAFRIEEWKVVKSWCKKNNVQFGLSVFAPDAVEWLRTNDCEPDYWKLGSGVSCNEAMIKSVTGGRLVVMSFGMANGAMMRGAIMYALHCGLMPTTLQCTSLYPCPPEMIGIDDMLKMSCNPCLPYGLSDHSGTIWPGIIAAQMCASMLEVHVTWSKECFGPDVSSSLTIDELRQLVQGVRFVKTMRENPVDKDWQVEALAMLREAFSVPT